MQGLPRNLLREAPEYVRQETDTATPRSSVPIYIIHDIRTPFCENPGCFCQRGVRTVTRLFGDIAEGTLLLVECSTPTPSGEAMSTTETTEQPRTVMHVNPLPDVPEDCQLFGHEWQQRSEQPGVKECVLCHIVGYCSVCTPVAPAAGALPFLCSLHARQQRL